MKDSVLKRNSHADIRTERPELRGERGVTQYQRLASLLRHRIASGEYPLGTRLPPITQLAKDLGVAVVTVRQAYELLSEDGLIHSQRGVGTHVAAVPAAPASDIELAINNPFAAPKALAFEILDIRRLASVPPELLGPDDRVADDYVCVRKLHTYSGEPFCYAEIYVSTSVFDSLPKEIARERKLLAAVLDELGARSKRIRQRTTVMPGDFSLCNMLKIPFASPVAKMSRRLVDEKGHVLYAGVTWYRGDRYLAEIDFPVSALKRMPGITEPKPGAGGERKRLKAPRLPLGSGHTSPAS